MRLSDLFNQLCARALRPFEITTTGADTLRALSQSSEPLTQAMLGERLFLTTGTVSTVLDTLQRRNLVQRVADPDDGRKLRVQITPEGKRLVPKVLELLHGLERDALSELSASERRTLDRLCARGIDAIDQMISDADAAVVEQP